MKKRTLGNAILLLALALAGALALHWYGERSHSLGEVLVRAGGYELHATLLGALLALLLAALLLWLCWKLVSAPFRAWGRRSRKRARARLIEGLELLHGGHWQRAEKLLEQAGEDAEVGTVARIAAARAAAARDDEAAVQRHLAALSGRGAGALALARAERARAKRQPGEALSVLAAPDAQPLPPRGLALQAEALAASNRAGEAYGLLGALKQQQALAAAAFAALESRLAAQAMREAADANALAERWETLPKNLRTEPAIVAAYAERAAALHWDDAAARSVEQALETRWDESLAALYGRLPIDKTDSRRASAQRWLASHPDSPALLVTLAQLARRQGQWPQAQDFLRRALNAGAGAEAWEELGHGFAAAGDDALSRRSYANALHARRGEATEELASRDLKQKIQDEAVAEERDEHGVPRLRG
ncbi:heme biosynthesis HemY N-terminal domain-containing protein [Pseudoxanthomonas sangjuensis]